MLHPRNLHRPDDFPEHNVLDQDLPVPEPFDYGMAAGISNHLLHKLRQLFVLNGIITHNLVFITDTLELQLHKLAARTDGYNKMLVTFIPVERKALLNQCLNKITDLPSIKSQLQVAIFHLMTLIHGNPSLLNSPPCVSLMRF
ncbi:hypothetical protein D3C75_809810 [compost metagenome]